MTSAECPSSVDGHQSLDTWSYYFHDPTETQDWTDASYHLMGHVHSVDEFWRMQMTLRPYLPDGMFFVFREDVFPKWDHPLNIGGGCVSFKVARTDIVPFLEGILIDVLRGDGLRTTGVIEAPAGGPETVINGISISPKNGFVVVKIWMRDEDCKHVPLRLPPGYKGDVLWRSNRESLKVDTARIARPPRPAHTANNPNHNGGGRRGA